jgi:ATP-dependent protease ClpP protease subunit
MTTEDARAYGLIDEVLHLVEDDKDTKGKDKDKSK